MQSNWRKILSWAEFPLEVGDHVRFIPGHLSEIAILDSDDVLRYSGTVTNIDFEEMYTWGKLSGRKGVICIEVDGQDDHFDVPTVGFERYIKLDNNDE